MKLDKLFIIILLISTLVFNSIYKQYKEEKAENFTSFYQDCINSGYSKEFCSQKPTNVLGPSGCLCHNGSVGNIVTGFGGRCVCNI